MQEICSIIPKQPWFQNFFLFFFTKHSNISELFSSELLHSKLQLFLTEVAAQRVGPLFKSQTQRFDPFSRAKYVRLLTLEYGTEMLCRNVGKKLPLRAT
jgi:hypothetical protein